MTESEKFKGLKSEDRRRFMSLTFKFGFTAASIAMVSGIMGSDKAVAMTANEEKYRCKEAKYIMNVATTYILGASRSYPIMQLDFKENIQNFTKGEVYVKLAPGSQLGSGSALVQKVQSGTIQVAQHSISNFAPFVAVADVINIPYWCGENQKFMNLVTSDIWKRKINPKIESKGFKVLWYVCIDPRTIALRKGIKGPIRTPEQLMGIKFRVSGSEILQKFYQIIGANPTPVAWGETSSAIKQGVADALDPSVEALLVLGFKDIISSVTFNTAVPDAQVFSCNLNWFNSLTKDVKEGINLASEITSRQNLAKVPSARAYAIADMTRVGVKFYTLTSDEKDLWISKVGYQLPTWDGLKKDLVGSVAGFDKLCEAANTFNNIYVHDM